MLLVFLEVIKLNLVGSQNEEGVVVEGSSSTAIGEGVTDAVLGGQVDVFVDIRLLFNLPLGLFAPTGGIGSFVLLVLVISFAGLVVEVHKLLQILFRRWAGQSAWWEIFRDRSWDLEKVMFHYLVNCQSRCWVCLQDLIYHVFRLVGQWN